MRGQVLLSGPLGAYALRSWLALDELRGQPVAIADLDEARRVVRLLLAWDPLVWGRLARLIAEVDGSATSIELGLASAAGVPERTAQLLASGQLRLHRELDIRSSEPVDEFLSEQTYVPPVNVIHESEIDEWLFWDEVEPELTLELDAEHVPEPRLDFAVELGPEERISLGVDEQPGETLALEVDEQPGESIELEVDEQPGETLALGVEHDIGNVLRLEVEDPSSSSTPA